MTGQSTGPTPATLAKWTRLVSTPLKAPVKISVSRPTVEGEGVLKSEHYAAEDQLQPGLLADLIREAGHPRETVRIQIYQGGKSVFDGRWGGVAAPSDPFGRALYEYKAHEETINGIVGQIFGGLTNGTRRVITEARVALRDDIRDVVRSELEQRGEPKIE